MEEAPLGEKLSRYDFLNNFLEKMEVAGELRQALENYALQVILPQIEEKILGWVHNISHLKEVMKLMEEAINLQSFANLAGSQVMKNLLAVAVVFHDFGAVPQKEGQRQAEIYPDHELRSVQLAQSWLAENGEAVESLGISLEKGQKVVRALILATTTEVGLSDLLPQEFPQDGFVGEERGFLAQRLGPKAEAYYQAIKEIWQELAEEEKRQFFEALQAISSADLGSYLKPELDFLKDNVGLWAEFMQGTRVEGQGIAFRKPFGLEYTGWLSGDFLGRVLAKWKEKLPERWRRQGEDLLGYQAKIAIIKENLNQKPDLVVRFEGCLLPPILISLAEDFGINLEVGGLEEKILTLGDDVLRATKKTNDWGPMASAIFEEMYQRVPAERKQKFLAAAIEKIRGLLVLGRGEIWLQISAGRYLPNDPEILSRLFGISQTDSHLKIFFAWRADQDSQETLTSLLEFCDGEKTGIALAGRLEPQAADNFFTELERVNYDGLVVFHWRRECSLVQALRLVNGFLGKKEFSQRRVVFHLDEGFNTFCLLQKEPVLWNKFKQWLKEGKLVLAASPWSQLAFDEEGLKQLVDWLRKEEIAIEPTTNNMSASGGMGRVLQAGILSR